MYIDTRPFIRQRPAFHACWHFVFYSIHINYFLSYTFGVGSIRMKDAMHEQTKDLPAYLVGFTGIGLSLADISIIAQQLGVILGTILVLATLIHRLILIYKDLKK